ncbi:hypothetical protein B0H16DRAFT_1012280 [Mycena metata]|uniref:Uncharacterized protein n=1 Tax=Mycena metata TaxID=1033252 RepID=A0AAD7IHH0_9AGAR|nr:hypothetical protein B0H16DRAFT_1012280 [Mycena metata]
MYPVDVSVIRTIRDLKSKFVLDEELGFGCPAESLRIHQNGFRFLNTQSIELLREDIVLEVDADTAGPGSGIQLKRIALNGQVPRDHLVKFLYTATPTSRARLFFVRGTPGSGKTTLCSLLYNHIISQGVLATIFSIWTQKDIPFHTNLRQRLSVARTKGCETNDLSFDKPHWLLFDEGQTTFWDSNLWGSLLKDIPQNVYVVVFALFGSKWELAGAPDVVGHPNSIANDQRLDLRPTNNGYPPNTFIPGLYFLRNEFAHYISQRPDLPLLEPNFADWIFAASVGHIGVIHSVLEEITRVSKVTPERLTKLSLDGFLKEYNSPEAASSACAEGSAFSRGLPDDSQLEYPGNAGAVAVLRDLLHGPPCILHPAQSTDATQAHRLGWITLEEDDASNVIVDFPSPLHRSRVSYLLMGSKTPTAAVEAMSLFQFVCKVVECFSSNTSAAGPSIPETQWRHEMYRAAYKVTEGQGLWLSPEFGTEESGRIDLMILGTKRWAIQILREGDSTEAHLEQFAPGGAYHHWMVQGTVKEYVFLDFKWSAAAGRKPFPNQPLFYVSFLEGSSRSFEIRDCNLQIVHSGTLYDGLPSVGAN